jgi:tRNA (cmo5U34)-methyltransferase
MEVGMAHDEIFAEPKPLATDFRFDHKTAAVFDDMVSRSVPFYHEIQRMTTEMAADFAVDGTNLYDLGCATCTTLIELAPVVSPGVRLVGIDSSEEMLAQAERRLAEQRVTRPIALVRADLHDGLEVQNASVVIMTLTLQFVRPLHRQRVIDAIYRGLNPQGCLLLVEKVTVKDSFLNRLFIKYYYAMKRRNGYSEMEIAQKREALENVLIPYRLDENRDVLRAAGFRHIEVFFRWYNFCGLIAVK